MSHVDEGQIHAYLDEQLEFVSPEARAELEAHVAECPSCASLLSDARRVHAGAADILAMSAPSSDAVPPFEDIARRARGYDGRRRLRRWRVLAVAASLVLALGVGYMARFGRSLDAPAEAPSVLQSAADEDAAGELDAVAPADDVADVVTPDAANEERGFARREAQTAPTADPAAEAGAGAGAGADSLEGRAAFRDVSAARTPPPPDAEPERVPPAAPARDSLAEVSADQFERRARAVAEEVQAQTRTDAERRRVEAEMARRAARNLADSVGRPRAQDVAAPAAAAPTAAAGLEPAEGMRRWSEAGVAAARARLGAAPLAVADLPVEQIALDAANDAVVRVVQTLPGGEELVLYQWAGVGNRLGNLRESFAMDMRTITNVVQRDGLTVLAESTVSSDSLDVLLGRLREAPEPN